MPTPGLLVEVTGPPTPLMIDLSPPEPPKVHGEQAVELHARRVRGLGEAAGGEAAGGEAARG